MVDWCCFIMPNKILSAVVCLALYFHLPFNMNKTLESNDFGRKLDLSPHCFGHAK